MKYLIVWDFNGVTRRFWRGFGSGFGGGRKSAKIFKSHTEASIEADKVVKWCWWRFGPEVDYGASVRPA